MYPLTQILKNKTTKYFLVYSILFSIACVATLYNEPFWVKIIVCVCLSILLYIILEFINHFIKKNKSSKKIIKPIILNIWIYCVIALLIFIPYFVFATINYPGLGTFDSDAIVKNALGIPPFTNWYRYDGLSTHHSLFYIFLFYLFNNLCLPFEDLNITIYIFLLFQSLVSSVFFAWTIYWAKNHINNQLYFVFLILFIIFNPILIAFVPQLLKDVPFTMCFIFICFKLLDLSNKNNIKKKDYLLFFMSMFLLVLFRNTGLLICLITLMFMFFLRIGNRKYLLIYFIFLLFYMCTCEFFLLDFLEIEKSHFVEMVSIPIQQMAYSYINNGFFTDGQLNFINNICPLDSIQLLYDPTSVHEIKFFYLFNDDFLDSHKLDFIINWLSILINNPLHFIQAWVHQSSSCWSPFTPSWIGEKAKIILCPATTDYYTIGLSPFLVSNFVLFRYTIFNSGLFFWIISAFLMFKYIYKRDKFFKKSIICFIPVFTVIVIFVLGNTSINTTFRYMLPVYTFIMYLPCFWNTKIQN